MSQLPKGAFLPIFVSFISLLAIYLYINQTNLQADQKAFSQNLLSIAQTGATMLNGNRFQELFSPSQRLSPQDYLKQLKQSVYSSEYAELKSSLNKIIAANKNLRFDHNNVYTFALDSQEPNKQLRWAVMAHNKPFTGESYPIQRQMRLVLSGKKAGAYTGTYLSPASNIRWISAYAAIKNEHGEVVGILEVARKVEDFLRRCKKAQTNDFLLLLGLLAVLLSVGVSVVYANVRAEHSKKQLDVSLQKIENVEQCRKHQLEHDSLTGLPNRSHFHSKLRQFQQALIASPEQTLGVIYIDLSNFRRINHCFGTQVGDQALVQISQNLQACIEQENPKQEKSSRFLARFPGDQFVIALKVKKSTEQIFEQTKQVYKSLQQPLYLKGQRVFLDANIGISLSDTTMTSVETLLEQAHIAVHQAKALGVSQYTVFSPEMKEKEVSQIYLEGELRKAIQNDKIELFFQPILCTRQVRTIGFEALSRWKHEDHGYIPPSTFIPLAEKSGLILPLGSWVLRTAIKQLKKFHRNGFPSLKIAVNISVSQILQSSLFTEVVDLLQEFDLPPDLLELEVTESVLIENEEQVRKTLNQLKNYGVKLSIDDFGTGYSSLSYLQRFPFHTLKVDKSFVRGIAESKEAEKLLTSILAMAECLSLDVIVEGVEELSQLQIIQQLYSPKVQGYLFGKPLPEKQALQKLQQFSTTPFPKNPNTTQPYLAAVSKQFESYSKKTHVRDAN